MAKLRGEHVMAAKVMTQAGESIRSVARRLGVAESTLRYRLGRGRKGAPRPGRAKQAEACGGWAAEVEAWVLEQERREARDERPASISTLCSDLRAEGYTGSYSSVVRAVRRRRTRQRRLVPIRRVEVKPGSQAQVDWIERRVHLGGQLTTIYGFLMVLGFSRAWALVWSVSMDLAAWIRCHNEALLRLGGVALTLRPDNLKTAVSRGAGRWGTLNAGYVSWASQVGALVIDPTRVRCPRDKGKVERRARDVESYIDLGREYLDLEQLQQASDQARLARMEQLRCPLTGTSVAAALVVEQQHLMPLPAALPRVFDSEVTRCADASGLVRFEGRQYQVPLLWIGREVRVRGCGEEVVILGGLEELACYPRRTACERLLDQDLYEGQGNQRVAPATPLGDIGRQITMRRSWEHAAAPRAIEVYAAAVAGGAQ